MVSPAAMSSNCFDSDSTCGTRSINLVRNSGVFEVDGKGVGKQVKSDSVNAITCECDFPQSAAWACAPSVSAVKSTLVAAVSFSTPETLSKAASRSVESAEILMTSAVPSPAAMVSLDKDFICRNEWCHYLQVDAIADVCGC